MRSERLRDGGLWALLAALATLGLVTMLYLGADAWPFEPATVGPRGVLGPLVRAADEEWDLGLIRSAAVLALVVVAFAAAAAARFRSWTAAAAVAVTLAVVALLLAPATLLQVGLRDATEPWFHTNDSTYQIELGGDLLLDGENPYGHDYRFSGLERFYELDGTVSEDTREEQVALRHFAYFPGTVVTAAAWRLLPRPFDDYRLFVLLATIGLFVAVLLFPAPLEWRLPLAAVAAANPLAIRAAWFGNADAPSLLCVVLAFALLTRSRYVVAATLLAAAIMLKQFAAVAVPFFVVALLVRGVERSTLARAGAAFAAVVAVLLVPFALWDPSALWNDTIEYGADTYRIVGYGLSALLLNLGVLDDRWGSYPFTLLAVLVWLPFTAWLAWSQWRARSLWLGGAGFAASIFLLVFLGRVFQRSYVIWPLVGIVLACVLYAVERRRLLPASAHADVARARGEWDAGEEVLLNSNNSARYAPYVRVFETLDARTLARRYFDSYPLFQRAYAELGFAGQRFHDRLIEAIDDLLEAPELTGAVKLVRPKVFYQFADPELESLSAGQKIMIRMGPQNAAKVKAKLRDIRRELSARQIR